MVTKGCKDVETVHTHTHAHTHTHLFNGMEIIKGSLRLIYIDHYQRDILW